MNCKGKVAVVTGGASGIGLAICKRLAEAGAAIGILDIVKDQAEKEAAALVQAGVKAVGVECNVANEASVEAAFNAVVDALGHVDIAVLNAGILRDGLLVKVDKTTGDVASRLSLQQWQTVIDVNLTGVFLSGREAATRMIRQKSGGVIVIMSSIARGGNPGQTNYSATKAGVASISVLWGKELAKFGIRCAGIAPGFIETPMVMKDMKPEFLEKWKKMIPIGRLGKPEEIADAVEFIVRNDLVNATVIDVAGGMSL
jgi:3-oxoacyl-[acyl-carrier protein] reductase